MLKIVRNIFKKLKREVISPVSWDNLRRLQPLSTTFGFDRGTPVDRHYITSFLKAHDTDIKGHVLEIAESSYSKQFGTGVTKYEVLHVQAGSQVTIIGDLTDKASLPENRIDCFICTQTFNFIYDFKTAIEGAYHLLKPGGVLLATLAGATQISAYDQQRWGDYWRFTAQSAEKVFGEIFGKDNIEIISYGNVLTCTAILQGISAEELLPEELDYQDPVYPIILAVRARKA
ncbi:methyltransferase domain-containing protein [Chitinophaga arvensicola]|uniref:Methyltransferase domain-containing protein n=1 Tax=Chitinophaga arvensicola TaxID=29529 RepID=A0A1I0S8J2_9BACT|nr:methyltransferase domain-containing protein [Chitinophaga arvensicola]SEW52426.1 Methyltransferase domain-containing protein [Chitinophaga arvensicola]